MCTQLSALPMRLAWQVPPVSCHSDDAARLVVRAPARSDLFVDPSGTQAPVLNAPRLLGVPPDGDFQFAARVTVGFQRAFDAGALLLWADERTWAKLCFECSPSAGGNAAALAVGADPGQPSGVPMVVSVVTRGSSDDANACTVDADQVWLRVTRVAGAWAFHAGGDGQRWQFVRYFSLGARGEVSVGFEAQSPTGDGCEVTFDQISYQPGCPADLRAGS